jgi:hypothetical protein
VTSAVEAARIPPCDLCGRVQTEAGAVLWGPPNVDGYCKKTHVCPGCHGGILGGRGPLPREVKASEPTSADADCA